MLHDRKQIIIEDRARPDGGSEVLQRPGLFARRTQVFGVPQTRRRFRSARRAFTLVEILIVVVILAIIAAITVPQMSNASMQARENMLRDDLRFLRNQIVLYRAQHHDAAPGAVANGSPSATLFVDQLTSFTDDVGNANPTMTGPFRFGPYLSKMPANPLNDRRDVLLATGAALPAPDDTTGWIFNPAMPEIGVNQSGADNDGVPYSTY
ncbi:MAG TPA: type II secretion system protein [Tepidisphaeraceae bacterium]|nr:type II secretion system protein [Tepidisphaeraceae bacterium]